MKRHWESWVTQDIIKELAESGAVNSLRVPVGDFMFEPYGPYIGCTDGALDYLDTLLDWAHGYGLSVLLDVHTQKDSQNGFDNGQYWGDSTAHRNAHIVFRVGFIKVNTDIERKESYVGWNKRKQFMLNHLHDREIAVTLVPIKAKAAARPRNQR